MKKRNILTMALCMLLTFAIGVGGTLAFLSDNDDEVINTFTFANGLKVTLTEAEPAPTGEEEIAANENKGYDYSNIVPGQTLNKEPVITLTETTVKSYVFAKLSGASAEVMPVEINSAWTLVGEADDYMNGVYYRIVEAAETTGVALFSEVVVDDVELEQDTVVELGDITIEVYACQFSGFDTVEDAAATATWLAA